MKSIRNTLLMATAVIALGACAKKAPPELPPAPGPAVDNSMGQDNSNVGNVAVPGSQADFLTKVRSDRILFDLDRYNVDADGQITLQSQAQWLAQYPNKQAIIEGHADERGTRDYNLALGERRANAAKNYLVSLGVSEQRLRVVSYGKERPAAMGSDEGSWAQNRRAVTVTID
ncbi:peptidoglycan-associated lipoprotein Pal [Blastomonas aquatica]|uniref:Peptidoglycan-associated lipoprotein n=1 Tax=Blastomonas aquatica TaxID=1510276 RepID=A0ABQ1JC42_9SPHN|nr:peptidoglycan-associated lipoprotein Pal [Blastomonas aquatica]GGB63337.1 peptidoglycan-associated lipoprotein [Blastomonas aquatica]